MTVSNEKIDEVIERLVNISSLISLESEDKCRDDEEALAWAIIALSMYRDNGWTSVFDETPEYLTNCIVYTQDNRCCMACLSGIDNKWYDERDLEVSAVWWRDMLPFPPDTPYED